MKILVKMNKWERELDQVYQEELKKAGTNISEVYADMLKRFKKEGREVLADDSNLTRTEKYNAQRKAALEKRIREIIEDLHPEVRKAIKELSEKSGVLGYYGNQYSMEQAVESFINMKPIDLRYLNTTINEKIDGKRFSERLYKDREKMARIVNREIVKSAEDGIGYKELAARLEAITQNDMEHSWTIARTESKRVRSTMHQDAYEEAQKAGVIAEKEWLHSGNTGNPRSKHQEMHGMRVPINGSFISPDGNTAEGPGLFGVASEDIRCGCWTVTHVLGIQQTGQEFEPKTNWQEWAKENDVGVD